MNNRGFRLAFILIGLLSLQSSQNFLTRYNVPPPPRVAAARAGIPSSCSRPVDADWIAQVNRLRWVAYSSPNLKPEPGYFQPSPDDIRADLKVLRKAGFNALVTYASPGVMGKEFPRIAEELGFKAILLGIWNPRNRDELKNAVEAAAATSIVMGFGVGNEGLYEQRRPYDISDLCEAMAGLRLATGLPAATSEQLDDYADHPELLVVGDWLFPIVHPYWHANNTAPEAVAWQEHRYAELSGGTDLFVFFKEVGLPTAGAFALSEDNHDRYYRELARTNVRFVYFEGFDQPSKTHAAVEPYWGLFHADRRPKLLTWNLIGERPFLSMGSYDGWIRGCAHGSDRGCALDASASVLDLGSGPGARALRAFLAFDTRGLPDEARVTAVKLKVRAEGVEGHDPLSGGRRVRLEACQPDSLTLKLSDLTGDSNCVLIGLFRVSPVKGWYAFDWEFAALQAVNLRGATRIRMSVVGEDDLPRGYIKFYSGDADPANRPVLVVRYDLP